MQVENICAVARAKINYEMPSGGMGVAWESNYASKCN